MPKPGDLRMYVESDPYEVKCDGCYGCFQGKYYGGEIDAKAIVLSGGTPYNKCHGTGTRTVRLRGWVKVVRDRFSLLVFYKDGFYEALSEMRLNDLLIKDHRAGTLPAELYKSDDNPDGLEASDA